MKKIYLFAIATILATASLMVTSTITTTAFAQIPTPSGTDPTENTGPGILPNGTVANITNSNATTDVY